MNLTPHFNGKRYLRFYDEHGLERCGSDGLWIFDQRLSNETAIKNAHDRHQKQCAAYRSDPSKYLRPRDFYCRVEQDRVHGYEVLTETHFLGDL